MTIHHLGVFGNLDLSVLVTSPPWYENCYFIRHVTSGETIIVDPGSDSDAILAHLSEQGAKAKAIWLTHGHPDHLGAAQILEQALDIDTHAHQDESPVIEATDSLNRAFTGKGLKGPERVLYFQGEPDLAIGGVPVKVIATPGHTPGGVVYDFGGFALTGDTLFQQGVGRTDLPGGSEEILWASITRMMTKLEDGTILFSGHGPGWSAKDAKRWWAMMA